MTTNGRQQWKSFEDMTLVNWGCTVTPDQFPGYDRLTVGLLYRVARSLERLEAALRPPEPPKADDLGAGYRWWLAAYGLGGTPGMPVHAAADIRAVVAAMFDAGLSVRAVKVVRRLAQREGLGTAADLAAVPAADWLAERNCGERTVAEIVGFFRGADRLGTSAPRDVPVVRAEKRPEGTAGYCDDRR